MANTVDKLLKVASNEVGYLEKKSNSQLDSKTANAGYNNWTKYGRDLIKWIGSPYSNGVAWCDMFYDWCMVTAYGKDIAKKFMNGWSAYTPTSAQYYVNAKRWHTKDPKPGDQIFFVTRGAKREIRNICHTGLVEKVDANYVYTIEGNTSAAAGVVANGGGVSRKKYPLNYERICGYGRPNFDEKIKKKETITKKEPEKKVKTKVIPALAISTPNLKKGSKGNEVKKLQKDLNFVLGTKLEVDGDFGKNTLAALKTFQTKYKLTVDGVYGSKSEAKMKSLLK